MIILASASPRRRELLSHIADFEVRPSRCDESCRESDPEKYVSELSRRKAAAVEAGPEDVVIGADTVVSIDGRILGKPKNETDAKKMLRLLSGRTNSVYTGVTVLFRGETHTFCERTDVTFFELSDSFIDRYAASGEPMDKAGAYGIQEGMGCLLAKRIEGDYFNIVGLPVGRLYRLLRDVGGIESCTSF